MISAILHDQTCKGNLAAVDFVLLLLAFSSGLQYAYSLATKRTALGLGFEATVVIATLLLALYVIALPKLL